jgi:hypothetical protein
VHSREPSSGFRFGSLSRMKIEVFGNPTQVLPVNVGQDDRRTGGALLFIDETKHCGDGSCVCACAEVPSPDLSAADAGIPVRSIAATAYWADPSNLHTSAPQQRLCFPDFSGIRANPLTRSW